jgi:hypothetical protein
VDRLRTHSCQPISGLYPRVLQPRSFLPCRRPKDPYDDDLKYLIIKRLQTSQSLPIFIVGVKSKVLSILMSCGTCTIVAQHRHDLVGSVTLQPKLWPSQGLYAVGNVEE